MRAHVCVSLFVMEMVGLPQGLPLSAILFPPLQGEAHARIYVPCAARTMLVILDIVSNFFSAFIIAFFFYVALFFTRAPRNSVFCSRILFLGFVSLGYFNGIILFQKKRKQTKSTVLIRVNYKLRQGALFKNCLLAERV